MTVVLHNVPLAEFTTLRVGGPAGAFVEAASPEEFIETVRRADAAGTPVFVLGGGSNVLIGDSGFDGMVVRPSFSDIGIGREPNGRTATVTAQAGCVWDDLVSRCVDLGFAGIEALSGIPGMIGSAVVQNIGAYGQEMASCLVGARLFDRRDVAVVEMGADELEPGYRTSRLRRSMEESRASGGRWYPSPRWIVLDATFELKTGGLGSIAHAQLARALGCEVGDEPPVEHVRTAVLDVRSQKGMVVDPDPTGPSPLHDRWSSGSFFTNPVLGESDAARLPEDAPRYDAGSPGLVKTSAAWLIEHAGFAKGFGLHGDASSVTLSGLHTLALTNRGDATASDVAELARTVRAGVREAFGVDLVPETVAIGVDLS